MNPTLIVSTDQQVPGQWQGCLRDASFKIVWSCSHTHKGGAKEAVECAKEEREKRQPTPVYTGAAPSGATHIGEESGNFYRPDDEGHLVQVFRRGRWVDESMHASNLLVSRAFIEVSGAPPRELSEIDVQPAPVAIPGQQQRMFNFDDPGEVAA